MFWIRPWPGGDTQQPRWSGRGPGVDIQVVVVAEEMKGEEVLVEADLDVEEVEVVRETVMEVMERQATGYGSTYFR